MRAHFLTRLGDGEDSITRMSVSGVVAGAQGLRRKKEYKHDIWALRRGLRRHGHIAGTQWMARMLQRCHGYMEVLESDGDDPGILRHVGLMTLWHTA